MPLDPETFDLFLSTLRRFVAERLRPLEEQVDREDEVPIGIVQEMRDMGLFGLSIPEEHGGVALALSGAGPVARGAGGPSGIVQEMRDMGLFGLSIPEEHGGLALTMSEEVRVALELGRTTPAFPSVLGTHVRIRRPRPG